MALGDADMTSGVFFSDFGVPVTFAGATVSGLFDKPGVDGVFSGVDVSDDDYIVKLSSTAFVVMPVAGSRMVVKGIAVQVRKTKALDDGSMVELELRKL